MNIDILDYVNEHEIKDAILSGLKGYAAENAERVISNCGYELATEISNQHLGTDAPLQIAKKCGELIEELSPHLVFSDGGWGRGPSEARRMLDTAVSQHREALGRAALKAIHNLTKSEIVDIVKSGRVTLSVSQ